MKSQKQNENECQRWADDIQSLNEGVRLNAKKWKIAGCFFAVFASLSSCGLFFAFGSIFKTATMANLALSLPVVIFGFMIWLVPIFYIVGPRVFLKIPLINNKELAEYGCFDFRDEWVYKYIDVFKQFDHKKIIIDATSPSRIGAAIFVVIFLIGLAFLDLYPQVHDNLLYGDIWGTTDAYTLHHKMLNERGVLFTNKDRSMIDKLSFATNLGLAWVYASLLLYGLFSILSPRKIIVFDREKKTITIPPRFRTHKEETIPFQKAVISSGQDDLRGVDGVVIANYQHLVGEVSLRFAGRVNGYCFARLIQSYMTEDDLSSHPEFETFKEIQEELRIKKVREEAKHQR